MPDESSNRRWTRIFKPDARVEVEEELAFHLEQRIRDNIARGMDADAAREAAQQRFGDVKAVSSECTSLLIAERTIEARREWLKFSWLDFKLGFRMLVRYPGLTVVGGLAMAFAIAIGASAFEAITQLVRPRLPFRDGDRIVAIRNWDVKANQPDLHTLHDFSAWREHLETVREVGAYRLVTRNLVVDGAGEPVSMAEISATAFSVTGVTPLRGRSLMAADERADAPPVIVISHDLWQSRFAGDPDVIGRVVELDNVPSTVVGVMPDGYAFPTTHNLWAPFRLRPVQFQRGEGPAIGVFGRLASGVTLRQAQSELTAIAEGISAGSPPARSLLQPQVMRFAEESMPIQCGFGWRQCVAVFRGAMYSGNLLFVVFLALICANVALLMFARAATRESEMIVRSALGASRARIITQLVTEALVLGSVAAVVGLAAAGFALRVAVGLFDYLGEVPFWWKASLSLPSALYAVVLTLLGAAIAGVLPALKVTRATGSYLQRVSAGAGGLQFGGVWTAVIVSQVALTVIFVALTFYVTQLTTQIAANDLGFPANEYLSVQLALNTETTASASFELAQPVSDVRFRTTYRELQLLVSAEPGVLSVTFANRLPGAYHDRPEIEMDGLPAPPDARDARQVQNAFVDAGFFDALGAPILAGRAFHPSDTEADRRVVIVNQSFVDRVLGGRSPIGLRLRYTGRGSEQEPPPWYEIVGLVRDLGMSTDTDFSRAGVYHPWIPGRANWIYMAVHIRGDRLAFVPRLRALAATVDPSLRLHDLQPLEETRNAEARWHGMWARILAGTSLLVLVVSLAGFYSVMSFTVSRRTREIGIRVALGADRKRIVTSIFARPLAQAGLGVVVGVGLLVAVGQGIQSFQSAAFVVAFTAVMMVVVSLACIVPVRRALRVQPIEALRADG